MVALKEMYLYMYSLEEISRNIKEMRLKVHFQERLICRVTHKVWAYNDDQKLFKYDYVEVGYDTITLKNQNLKNFKSWKSANFSYEIREQNSISNKFSKTTKFFHEIRELFFVFVLKCTQREHVHNLNRRWARSALKV